MTREEALKNAIEALSQWSQGTVATAVVLAAIAKLELTRPPPRRPRKRKVTSYASAHDRWRLVQWTDHIYTGLRGCYSSADEGRRT